MIETFVTVVHDHSLAFPNKIALVDEFGSYTYQELDRLSNGVAAKLIGQGIGTGDIVPILMTRSKAFVAAFIGVMKSGAAFVPLDINYPEERIKSIEESVDAEIVIDDEWMKSVAPSDEFINNSKPDDLAFIIFTSGTTGTPKGVIHTHTSATSMSISGINKYPKLMNIIYSSTLGNNFIGGMTGYLTYLAHGHTIYILSDKSRKDINSIIDTVISYKITTMRVTPSVGKLLLNHSDISLGYLEFAGEQVMPICSKGNIKILINRYGCSEFSPAFVNHNFAINKPVSIGIPSKFTKPFIILEDNTLAHKGETGELCLAGPQMASGYWKMPELTAEKFVHCPFLPGDVKMYKTGDLARYREDGNIELVGRKDFQIKIRGFRIEPGEIENVAIKFDGIDTVVVVAKEMGAEKQLVLYYTSNAQVDETRLKEYLSKYLADYMVPNFYVRLDEMPRNANGKIDRSALPEPITKGSEKVDKPATELEKIIFDAVANEIGRSDFGVFDSFESLGLSSIGLVSMAASLMQQNIIVGFDEVADANCVRLIAERVSKKVNNTQLK